MRMKESFPSASSPCSPAERIREPRMTRIYPDERTSSSAPSAKSAVFLRWKANELTHCRKDGYGQESPTSSLTNAVEKMKPRMTRIYADVGRKSAARGHPSQ